MKIQCDVCAGEEASVFCCADEAALCSACDHRVHRANKLAVKHRRLALLSPSSSSSSATAPLCDICQEKRGFIFCQEDRAILCRDCDVSIHSANEHTKKHNRFLLAGVRLSSAPAPEETTDEAVNNQKLTTTTRGTNSTSSSSSISDYLIKTLPGWRVDDFLVDDAAAAAAVAASTADGFFQMDEIFLEADLAGGGTAELPAWAAPHVPQAPPSGSPAGGYNLGFGGKEVSQFGSRPGKEQWSDDAFMVPQISPAAGNNDKRPRSTLAAAVATPAAVVSSSVWYY